MRRVRIQERERWPEYEVVIVPDNEGPDESDIMMREDEYVTFERAKEAFEETQRVLENIFREAQDLADAKGKGWL